MIAEHELDNLLVRQKDSILHLINAHEYGAALVVLEIVKPLWSACSYSYKLIEVAQRIEFSVRIVLENSSDMMDSKQLARWVSVQEKINIFLDTLQNAW